ncbi:MAG: serine hydrolase [Deltaproteobacteria bacterium]|nr:serine hydrolase [Deltaproteobacteria bacterium]
MERRNFLGLSLPVLAGVMALSSGQALAGRKRKTRKKKTAAHSLPWLVHGKPNVQALGAAVMDIESGRVLFSKRQDVARPIASVSKLIATLTIVDHGLDENEVTTIAQVDADAAKGGATSRLFTGMTLSNLDLLHAALLGSDNRAVSALGRAAGLNLADLTAAMNKKAASLGLTHTRFREPTGLSPDNVATPLETLRMLREAIKNPRLQSVLSKLDYDAHPISKPPIHYTATYKPAQRSNAKVLGGKTGYNDFARYCLVAMARIDSRDFAVSFLGTEGKLTRFGDFARVADWIVAHKPHRKLA